jgi:hypothetical protein
VSKTKKTLNGHLTGLLRSSLEGEGYDANEFLAYFLAWKDLGPNGEYADPYFGKDGEYGRPVRNGKRVLRHVHLPPETDASAIKRWNRDHKQGSRKTSDTSLVYAYDQTHGYLLIYIAREPDGHAIAEMRTAKSRQLMENFADVAERFCHDGTVLI